MAKGAKIFSLFLLFLFLKPYRSWAKDWDPRLMQISTLAYQGNYQQAAAVADAYIQEKPEDPNGYMMKAMVFDWERNLTSQPGESLLKKTLKLQKKANLIAFHHWDKNRKNPDYLIDLGNSYIFLARVYSDQGSWFKAVLTAKKGPKHLKKALKEDPDRVDGLLAAGVFHYVADNTPKSAAPFKALLGIKGSKTQGLAELNQALTRNHPYRNDALVALYHIYFTYEKNYPKALEYLSRLQSQFPENPLWPFLKAEVREKQDKAQGLKAYLQAAKWCQARPGKCDAKFPFTSYFRAGRLALDLKQTSHAQKFLNQALEYASPFQAEEHSQALLLLGKLEETSGHPDLALGKFREAKKINGIQKDQKKKLEKLIKKLCQNDPPPGNC